MDLPFNQALFFASLIGLFAAVISKVLIDKVEPGYKGGFDAVERVFRYLQILTACYVAFAHGANDVANSIGPVAAVISVIQTKTVQMKVDVPIWLLFHWRQRYCFGLATYGYKVIEMVGKKITEITPTRGFSAEFGAATTVLIASKLGTSGINHSYTCWLGHWRRTGKGNGRPEPESNQRHLHILGSNNSLHSYPHRIIL